MVCYSGRFHSMHNVTAKQIQLPAYGSSDVELCELQNWVFNDDIVVNEEEEEEERNPKQIHLKYLVYTMG